jgi:hypothetical protein
MRTLINAAVKRKANREKAMAKKPPEHRTVWTQQDVTELRRLAKGNTPTRVMGLKLGRTPAAVSSKASEKGISLKPTNQSPYNRRRV